MHLLAIFLQYLLGRLPNEPQPQPVPIPVGRPNAKVSPDRQAFVSTSDPPGRTPIFYGSTGFYGSRGHRGSGRNAAHFAVAVLSTPCLGVGRPELSSSFSAWAACAAFVELFSPEVRALRTAASF